jgi:hypothetical protein
MGTPRRSSNSQRLCSIALRRSCALAGQGVGRRRALRRGRVDSVPSLRGAKARHQGPRIALRRHDQGPMRMRGRRADPLRTQTHEGPRPMKPRPRDFVALEASDQKWLWRDIRDTSNQAMAQYAGHRPFETRQASRVPKRSCMTASAGRRDSGRPARGERRGA